MDTTIGFWRAPERPRSGCPINLTIEALGDRWRLIVGEGRDNVLSGVISAKSNLLALAA